MAESQQIDSITHKASAGLLFPAWGKQLAKYDQFQYIFVWRVGQDSSSSSQEKSSLCWGPRSPQKFRKSHWCVPFTATFSKRRKIGALWSERCDAGSLFMSFQFMAILMCPVSQKWWPLWIALTFSCKRMAPFGFATWWAMFTKSCWKVQWRLWVRVTSRILWAILCLLSHRHPPHNPLCSLAFGTFAWSEAGQYDASAGNRTRVTSMATMYSTTRPRMQCCV